MPARSGKAKTPKCSFRSSGSCLVGTPLLNHTHYSSSESDDDWLGEEEKGPDGSPVRGNRNSIAVVAVASVPAPLTSTHSRPRSAWGGRDEEDTKAEIENAMSCNNRLKHELDEKKVVVEDLKDAAFSPDESLLIVGGPDQRVCVYDASTGRSMYEFDACKGTVVNCVAATASNCIITGGQDGYLRVWKATDTGDATASNLTLLRKLKHPKAVKACATALYSGEVGKGGARTAEGAAKEDGAVVVGAGASAAPAAPAATVVDESAANTEKTALAHARESDGDSGVMDHNIKDDNGSGRVNDARTERDGLIATGCADGQIRIWECGGAFSLLYTIVHGCSVASLAFSPDGTKVVAGGYDWRVKVWNWAADALDGLDGSSNSVPTQFCAHRGNISALAFSNKGDLVASGSRDTTCRLWPLSGTDVPSFNVLRAHLSWVRACCFSKEDDSFASACDELICIWGVVSMTLVKVFPAYLHMTHTCIFSRHTGQLVVAGGVDLDANPPEASEEDQEFERHFHQKLDNMPILIEEVDDIIAMTMTRDGKAKAWRELGDAKGVLHDAPRTVLVQDEFLRVDPFFIEK